ncbi:hypothetical protein OQA88_12642 [Cercophora sp. LCS_1]
MEHALERIPAKHRRSLRSQAPKKNAWNPLFQAQAAPIRALPRGYGMPPPSFRPTHRMPPPPFSPSYGMPSSSLSPGYGMPSSSFSPGYGMVSPPVPPSYGMVSPPVPPSYGMLPSFPRFVQQAYQEPKRVPLLATSDFPSNVLSKIVSHLGYLDVIRLAQTNRWLHDHVKPDEVDAGKKGEFILNADIGYKKCSPRQTIRQYCPDFLACYHCFRIKGYAEFERPQYPSDKVDRFATEATSSAAVAPLQAPTHLKLNPFYDPSITATSLAKLRPKAPVRLAPSPLAQRTWGIRRFCIPCGVRKGYYGRMTVIDVQGDTPGRRPANKWTCRCPRKVHRGKPAIRCRDCKAYKPAV